MKKGRILRLMFILAVTTIIDRCNCSGCKCSDS